MAKTRIASSRSSRTLASRSQLMNGVIPMPAATITLFVFGRRRKSPETPVALITAPGCRPVSRCFAALGRSGKEKATRTWFVSEGAETRLKTRLFPLRSSARPPGM